MTTPPENAPRPSIYRYRDYRRFLADIYAFKKSLRAGFSYRRFSQLAGLKSPNYLQLVIQGQRKLSEEVAEAIATALHLSADEKAYFVALVGFENAKTESGREKMQAEIFRRTKKLASREIPRAQAEVLTEWYHLLVRELVALPDFEASGEWISRRLRDLISVAEAEASLSLLEKSGFLRQENGRYRQTEPVIDTGDAFNELQILSHHRRMLETWMRVLPRLDRDKRELGILNIPISSDKLPELKARIRRFQDEIIGWLESETAPDRIVQLGTYMIPITGPGEGHES